MQYKNPAPILDVDDNDLQFHRQSAEEGVVLLKITYDPP